MAEVNALDHVGQLELMEKLSSLTSEVISEKDSDVGRFSRNGKNFFRMRIGDLRIYLERGDKTLHCLYILRKNTFNDFVVRFKLPVSEEKDLEKDQSFWNYLEALAKRRERE
ncbi:MAG: cytotoxic translational repressor of toxin-antitoxin stability system [Verrucomicrobia bacterium]|nr:cytotoxic translational repressor of toxin-antitoxin stability system [Verrucomicrobiota bacterium]